MGIPLGDPNRERIESASTASGRSPAKGLAEGVRAAITTAALGLALAGPMLSFPGDANAVTKRMVGDISASGLVFKVSRAVNICVLVLVPTDTGFQNAVISSRLVPRYQGQACIASRHRLGGSVPVPTADGARLLFSFRATCSALLTFGDIHPSSPIFVLVFFGGLP